MESSELSLWLQTIGLSSCCKPLWDAGFRDLESVASVTEVQLKEAGVDKKTINKLLWEIDKLIGKMTAVHIQSTKLEE